MRIWVWLLGLAALAGLAPSVPAQDAAVQLPGLSLEQAVRLALQNNPDLAVVRKQRGIAAAGVVIARTYPFNPVYQTYVYNTDGPSSAGITNRVSTLQTVRLDLELHGQRRIREGAAQATLSRTEWEIANQELLVAVRAIRAYYTMVYRRDKLDLLEEAVRLQEEAIKRMQPLVKQGQLQATDLILANADLLEARAAVGPGRALLVQAWNELRRVLGQEGPPPALHGELEAIVPEIQGLEQIARQRRPDLRALQMLVAEADQRVRLEIANRYGNPSLGPAYDYNETRVNFIGVWMIYALPVLNTRRGDIQQRQAERDRAVADAKRLEMQIGLDLQAAGDRLAESRKWVDYFANESLPTLRNTAAKFDELFKQSVPGFDVLRVIDTQRRLLRARDAYLDALWELSQARADLAAAVGDFALVLCPPPAPQRPMLLTPVFLPE
jgi:outer membrane protein TolC